jgi:hypothetical protein
MNDRTLRVGTTPADTAYHACRRESPRSDHGPARCGIRCRLTPQPWDRERQRRQDSCHRCVAIVARLIEDREQARLARGGIIAGYIRASTDKQVESDEVQEATIRRYCDRQGLAEPRLYVDPATSGDRPVMDR